MKIAFDHAKRAATLKDRGLDFADAVKVFAGQILEFPDERFDYGEALMITVGFLNGRMMIVVWTERAGVRHVISMRKTNAREKARFGQRLGQG